MYGRIYFLVEGYNKMYKVVYYILGKEYQTETYQTNSEAESQLNDIAGYENVFGAHIVKDENYNVSQSSNSTKDYGRTI